MANGEANVNFTCIYSP